MIVSRRDYILRIIDEVAQLLARVIFKRRSGADQEALEIVVQSCERLFSMERDKLFQFTPDQHYAMLVEGEPPELARNKVLLYAALNAEAGWIYRKMGNQTMARATLLNALRFALMARTIRTEVAQPDYAPMVDDIVAALGGRENLDAEMVAMLDGTGESE